MATNLEKEAKNAVIPEEENVTKSKKNTSKKSKTVAKKSSSKTKKTAKTNKVNNTSKKTKKVSKPKVLDSAIVSEEPKVEAKEKRTITHVRMPKNKKVVSEETKDVMKEPKRKRTLRLNMHFGKETNTTSEEVVADTSINQNSPFFYEPSVFEKFNLTISDVDNITSEEDDDVSNDVKDEVPVKKGKSVDDDILSSTTDYHTDTMKAFIENRMDELLSGSDSENESADNFFDSSIPSISNGDIRKKQRKLKSTISPIFKKFNFDETNIIKPIINESDEIPTNIIIPKEVNNKADNIELPLDNTVPSVEISAASTSTVEAPVVETDVSVLTSESSENSEGSEDILNVVLEKSSTPTFNLDEDAIEELLAIEVKNEDSEEPVAEVQEEIDYENSNSLDHLPEIEDEDEDLEVEEYSFDENFDYNEIEKEENSEYNDETFSIESYFGLDHLTDEDFKDDDEIDEEAPAEEDVLETTPEDVEENEETNKFSTITKLLESFNASINNLSDKISVLEEKTSNTMSKSVEENEEVSDVQQEEPSIEPEITEENVVEENEETKEVSEAEVVEENVVPEEITEPDISDEELLEYLVESEETPAEESKEEVEESADDEKLVEDILSEALLSNDSGIDEELKNSLLSEMFTNTTEEVVEKKSSENTTESDEQIDSDFSKVLECLTHAITELETAQPEKQVVASTPSDIPAELSQSDNNEDGKTINILINKDDIFSIQILNETYEIVADFDGISVLSENIHISTPKNNFYVKIGEKYIEIHNKKNQFIVHTNFEDVEFANAINNVGFAKKNNRIELNIKEAFKLASVNNRIELSMLNKTIASIKDTPVTQIDEGSICDNRTLLISEETQKVYLPYTISEVMNKLKYNDEFKSVQDVVDKEYTVPLSTFKMPIISRFKEAYRFMRTKENSSVYAAIDLAVELMFNSNLNPAVIRAAKDLKELNIYLDCLYENEIDKFDCFKIVYKVLPKIK